MPRQYIECCLCGHKFEAPYDKDLEKCPKCRSRRLMRRPILAAAQKDDLKQHSEQKGKSL